ncbi:MAG: Hpt domain-containing protein [Burkholderiaceae bacterium]|nr:Hpt domain-containing protein [Burkholderiaceae bacterium]
MLDAAALARLSELDPTGDGTLVQRVLATYATSLERSRSELSRARQPMQPEVLRHLAHTLKSSSASVGALALSALCAQVEHRVRVLNERRAAPEFVEPPRGAGRALTGPGAADDPGDIDSLLDAMLAEMRRVSDAVQAMLQV